LQAWKHGFNSPFKSEVYFVSTKPVTDLKWGTPKPIIMRDADFGSLRIRAFGTYTLRVIDPSIVIRELVGTDGVFNADELTELLRSIIGSAFADLIGEAKVPVLDLAAKYGELSDQLRAKVCERIDDEYGLEVPLLRIVNISLPEEVEKALDTRTSMNALGDMQRFQQFQMANAIPDMAKNPGMMGGGIGAGMGMGMGMAMANQMAGMMPQPGTGGPGMMPPPPPPPPQMMWHVSVNGQTQGPFAEPQFWQMIQQGQVTAATMVWAAGLASWQAAGQVPQLAHFFAKPPPPPPPPPR
jgi:membrane protease subunit (stomatin/prohibitin family)